MLLGNCKENDRSQLDFVLDPSIYRIWANHDDWLYKPIQQRGKAADAKGKQTQCLF